MRLYITMAMVLAVLAALIAIGCEKESVQEEAKVVDLTQAEPEKAKQADPDPAAAPAAGGDVYFSANHILIAFRGADNAPETVTLSKEEAKKLAENLIEELKEEPKSFEDLAKKHSSCPSRLSGGDLGSWKKGMMVPEFDVATEKLKTGAITQEPVLTNFGYHIIRRNPEGKHEEVAALMLIVSFKGAPSGAPPEVTRSKEEALKLADEALVKLKKDPGKFETIAKEYNDGPNVKLPIWTTGTGMPKEFDEAVLGLKIGELSDVKLSPYGYHVFKRIEVVHGPMVAAHHILIQFKGAMNAPATVTRSKEEAKKLSEELFQKTKAIAGDKDKFGELVMKHSEDPMASMNQGYIGTWEQGQMMPEIDSAVEKIKVGEVAAPVESSWGFHVIMRTKPGEEPPMPTIEPGSAPPPLPTPK